MSDINFLPIFNQAESGVWEDFARIRDAATYHVCGYSMTSKDYDELIKEFMRNWRRRSFNFAFGAYQDDEMVGFVQGDCTGDMATINSLYVMPEHMNKKIGSKLLRLAEKAGAFGATALDLVSLCSAQKFYERYNYIPLPIMRTSNHYRKNITKQMRPTSTVVPVFKVTKDMDKVCKKISGLYGVEFDASYVNSAHLPMFLYVDAFFDIQGMVLGEVGKRSKINIYVNEHQPKDFIKSKLDKEFKNFRRSVLNRLKNQKINLK